MPNMKQINGFFPSKMIDRLDAHVKEGDASSRSDLIRVACQFWLDNHPLPEEIEIIKLMATMKNGNNPLGNLLDKIQELQDGKIK